MSSKTTKEAVVTTCDSEDNQEISNLTQEVKEKLSNELDVLQMKVMHSLRKNDERKEYKIFEERNRTLLKNFETLKKKSEEQRDIISSIKQNLNVTKEELETKIKELEARNEVLAAEVKCKDVSLSLLQENIVFARQNTEAANNIIETERKEFEEFRKLFDKLKSENEIKDIEIKALHKQLQIEKLTKEVTLISSNLKRRQPIEGCHSKKRMKMPEREEKATLFTASNDQDEACNSDIASIYDPEEEVEDEVEFLESMKGEVDCIIRARVTNNNEEEFFVKWKNKSYAEATWEIGSLVKTKYVEELNKFLQRQNFESYPKVFNDAIRFKTRFSALEEQPAYIGSESHRLKSFQIDGLNFLLNNWHRGQSAILADQEGLGKTVQAIAFLKYLFHNFNFKGPMLVCVPTCTLVTWQLEFQKWAPDMVVVCYAGDSKSRNIIRSHVCENSDRQLTFNVLLTNYELLCKDKAFIQDIVWSNIILDGSDRLKSKNSKLFKVMMSTESHHRLILTADPPQSSLEELWCLLNFLKLKDVDVEEWENFIADNRPHSKSEFGKIQSAIKLVQLRRRLVDLDEPLPWLA